MCQSKQKKRKKILFQSLYFIEPVLIFEKINQAIDHALEEITIDTKPLQKKAEALSLTVEKLLKQEKSESKSVSSMYL